MSIQKLTPTYLWLHAIASRFIGGAVTAFLTISGSSTVVQAVDTVPVLSLKYVAYATAMGGLIGAATYLKEHQLPDIQATGETPIP